VAPQFNPFRELQNRLAYLGTGRTFSPGLTFTP
jgi:hypothetical protein